MLRRRLRILVALLLLALTSCGEKTYKVRSEQIPLPLGETTVDLVVHRSEARGLVYVNLHDDEQTSVEATLSILEKYGGMLYELQHTGERLLSFNIDDSTYAVDPNRIFTDLGIDSTLARNSTYSPAARRAVRAFSDSLLQRIDMRDLDIVVTVHNNTEGGYSAMSYEDGELAAEARFVHIAVDEDPDDFYFVTTQALYDGLRDAGSNVVMQDLRLAKDDGSLSVRAEQDGIPYVNVEAQHGHFEIQREMLARLHHMLFEAERPL